MIKQGEISYVKLMKYLLGITEEELHSVMTSRNAKI